MTAVWVRFFAELRARWRAWLALSVLVALFFGPALAAFAGARRTNSVYSRFLKKQNAWDVIVLDASMFAPILWKPDFDALERLPYVQTSVRIVTGSYVGMAFAGDVNGRYGTELNRAKLLEGRLPRADAPDEIAVPYFQPLSHAEDPTTVADQHALARAKIGSRVSLLEPCEPGSSPACKGNPPVIRHSLTVVGRTISPFDFRPNEFEAMGFVSAALLKKLSSSPPGPAFYAVPGIALKFRHPGDVARFDRDVRAMTHGKAVLPLRQAVNERAVNSSARLQGMAVGLLAVFAGLTAILLMSQTLARQTVLESGEHPTLRSLGMSRGQTFMLGVARAALIATLGAVLAGLAAWLSSGLFPFGVFRFAEPSPGLRFDVVPMVLGPLAILVVAVTAVVLPSWRSAVATGEAASTPSRAAGAMARAGMPSTAVAGVRLALERGRGRTAVPVRSTITIVTLGIAAMVAALTISSSIGFLLDTPELYGKTWDKVVNYPDSRPLDQASINAIAAQPEVRDVALADVGAPFLVDGHRVGGMVITNVKGSMYPPILEGRAPAASDEIALGTKTLRALGKHVDVQHPQTVRLGVEGIDGSLDGIKVVGRVVVPPVNNYSRFGEGILAENLQPLAQLVVGKGIEIPQPTDAIVRFRPGSDPLAVIARVAKKFSGLRVGDDFARRPSDVVDFGRVKGMPLILSGVLAMIGVLSLAHAIASAIRRRRRDLAILKTIGFVRAQVRRAVAWQSSTLIVVAVAFGIPIGIVGGRTLWNVIAGTVGVVPSARIPVLTVALLTPAALLLANGIAMFPARAAARTQPALVLRAE